MNEENSEAPIVEQEVNMSVLYKQEIYKSKLW